MARIVIRPDLTDTLHMVATPPAPKLADAATGLVATDRESGAQLYTVQLLETYDGTAQLIKVTVPEGGFDTSLTAGAVVRPVGLLATPWANVFNGQVQHGVAYRAASLASSSATGVSAAPADAPKAAKS
ncbi:hypothetical protein CFP65_3880 [Kitasatospora sp. MMS16-BH015]|uniref:SCO3933 family regulatory protein n=1 Tax=Kitasatospora sp. MMS16-BH015 TaxID=2018025 RepID=UPI000CA14EC4|nr:hypothetical protein [Kitasatospora sp. MMS16-BH015]AUG78657.1 hypothetical protein CFP65_3880 [Kitasatospora sp. MMS16-BH015]